MNLKKILVLTLAIVVIAGGAVAYAGSDDLLEFSDLSQNLQDKLIELYGDFAHDILFENEEMAEEIANGAAPVMVMKATMLTPAQPAEKPVTNGRMGEVMQVGETVDNNKSDVVNNSVESIPAMKLESAE